MRMRPSSAPRQAGVFHEATVDRYVLFGAIEGRVNPLPEGSSETSACGLMVVGVVGDLELSPRVALPMEVSIDPSHPSLS
jgi:hypothetical protein